MMLVSPLASFQKASTSAGVQGAYQTVSILQHCAPHCRFSIVANQIIHFVVFTSVFIYIIHYIQYSVAWVMVVSKCILG